jgi:NAD(P)-dependent dehydrogenase (short-subunit alcohol dehydrogenase family)
MDIDGKVAVITGGAAGIGFGLARALAGAGARVVLADIEQGALDEAVAWLARDGYAAQGVRTDVSDSGSVDTLARQVVAEWGGVDILCNNAGVAPDRRPGAVWEIPLEDWKWGLDRDKFLHKHGSHPAIRLGGPA